MASSLPTVTCCLRWELTWHSMLLLDQQHTVTTSPLRVQVYCSPRFVLQIAFVIVDSFQVRLLGCCWAAAQHPPSAPVVRSLHDASKGRAPAGCVFRSVLLPLLLLLAGGAAGEEAVIEAVHCWCSCACSSRRAVLDQGWGSSKSSGRPLPFNGCLMIK